MELGLQEMDHCRLGESSHVVSPGEKNGMIPEVLSQCHHSGFQMKKQKHKQKTNDKKVTLAQDRDAVWKWR